MQTSAPWFVWLILEVPGVLFIATGIPLARRRIRPNLFYGARFGSTLSNETVWYEINARCGRHFVAIGVVYLVLLNTMLLADISETATIAIALGFMLTAVLVDAMVLYRAANRLAQQRAVAGRQE